MAIVVSEYGKVLGLVTMDDLLAQIFGVLRDERADLQASLPGIKTGRVRTPGPGVQTGPIPTLDSGPVPRHDVETGPIQRIDESAPVKLRATSDISGPVAAPTVGEQPSEPPAQQHQTDETTPPPPADIDELARRRERKS
jgi:hypothetical protein